MLCGIRKNDRSVDVGRRTCAPSLKSLDGAQPRILTVTLGPIYGSFLRTNGDLIFSYSWVFK
jgi:hypothetical protein